MLSATPEIDTSLAQTQWDDFVQDAGQGLDKVVGKGNKVEDSLKGIGNEAKKTASAVASIDLAQKMEKAVGHIGDVKDILQKAGGAVFGFSKETTEAIGKVGDLAEKGASLGSAFGPIGAVVGASLGALTGAFVAWSEATEKARVEQEKLIRDTINNNFIILQKQKALVQASTKTWDDYATAVRRAGGIQISAIESVLQVEQEATKKQIEDVDARAALWKKNIDFFVDLRKQRTLTMEEVQELTKNEVGYANTVGESWRTQAEAVQKFSAKIMPDLAKAFDNSDRSTEEFNKELAKIGKEETLKDLQADLVGAQTELTNAETKVKDLKTQLTEGPKENEGFFDYMARLKGLLIDSQNAANDLATAQGKVLGAAGAVDTKKKSGGSKGKSEAQLNKEANAEFERQLRNSEEQARQADIQAELDYWAELDKLADEGHQYQIDAVNNAIQAERDAQKKADEDAIQAEKDRIAEVQAIKKENDDKEAQRKIDELAATQAFYDSIKQGAIDVGATVANALAGEAVQAFDAYLDAVANGEKRTKESNKRQRVEFLRKTGTMLVTDGTGHVIAGTVKGIAGDPLGWAEAIAGAGEIAVGAGMGGIGAIGQRSLGGTQAKVDSQAQTSGSSVGGGSTGTQTLSPIIVNFQSVTPASEREQQEIGDKLKGLISASDRRSR